MATYASAPCWECGGPGERLLWQNFADGRRHLRLECDRCGRFKRYVRQTPANVARAEGLGPTPAAADDAGVLLAEVRELVLSCRPKGDDWTDLRRRLGLTLDLAGDAAGRGDAGKLRLIYSRLWAWAEAQQGRRPA